MANTTSEMTAIDLLKAIVTNCDRQGLEDILMIQLGLWEEEAQDWIEKAEALLKDKDRSNG